MEFGYKILLLTLQPRVFKNELSANIGLAERSRNGIIDILHTLLANESVLSFKTRNYHWNIIGSHFSELYKFFEEQYETLDEIMDQVAQRSRSMGGKSIATMTEFLVRTNLREHAGYYPDERQMISDLLADHETLIQDLRQDLDTCMSVYRDAGTNSFLVGIMEEHEKMAWMLRAYLSEK
jgi:starvation-inducible DNA-binding protein